MDNQVLLEKVAQAKRDILDAENHLTKVLQEIQTAPRADKAIISKVVQEAFSKLNGARTNLFEVEAMVKIDET